MINHLTKARLTFKQNAWEWWICWAIISPSWIGWQVKHICVFWQNNWSWKKHKKYLLLAISFFSHRAFSKFSLYRQFSFWSFLWEPKPGCWDRIPASYHLTTLTPLSYNAFNSTYFLYLDFTIFERQCLFSFKLLHSFQGKFTPDLKFPLLLITR